MAKQTASQNQSAVPLQAERRRVYRPAVDIVESGEGVRVTVDMPGVDASGVDVTVDRNVLTIRGTVKPPALKGMRQVLGEYEPGDYERSFTISEDLDRESMEGSLKSGVLTLSLARSKAAGPKKVTIKTG